MLNDGAQVVAAAQQLPEPVTRIRSATARKQDAQSQAPLISLLGPLMQTPGITVLVASPGNGKSVLAVHIGDVISSSKTHLLGLPCDVEEKVLLYDFELTDRQFEKRFADFPFTDKMLTGDMNPAALDALDFTFDQIHADLDRTGARVVIVDNITALAMKNTADADVSMGIMRGLKRLQIERGISSLVLAHTPKIPDTVPLHINHLAGSKHLSNFADSIFFIGRSVTGPNVRYIKQVKNRNDEEMPGVLVFEITNAPGYLDVRLIGPDEEFNHLAREEAPRSEKSEELEEKKRKLWETDWGMKPMREIAEALDASVGWVCKWRPLKPSSN
ncbi:AAA family ATPase [Hymenobacter fastidiosus]|uniref:AAA family ATPase n=1 Tax=Hymenobacter fastidiosus TaxID=486264 RepID=UPI0031EDD854